MEYTVIRVYGRFAWPPLLGDVPTGDAAPGVVEFGFIDIGEPLRREPFVRWVPKDQDPVPVSEDTKNIAAFDEGDRSMLRTTGPGAGFAYLLGLADPVAAAPSPACLRFRGAVVLEQCRAVGGTPNHPMMRWLLARTYWRAGIEAMSEVLVGLKGDKPRQNGSSFALALALPTPVALSVTQGKECRAFPFVARYRPARPGFTPDKPLDCFSVAPGTFDEGASAAQLRVLNAPLHANHLGGFGFCRTDGGKDALYLPRIKDRENDVTPPLPDSRQEEEGRRKLRDSFWLSDTGLIASGILGPLLSSDSGIAKKIDTVATDTITVSPTSRYSYETTAGGERLNSIYFSGDSEGNRTVMRFRHAIAATGRFATGPLKIKNRDFAFDVPELGGTELPSNSPLLVIEFSLEYAISADDIWDAVRGVSASTGQISPAITLTAMCGFKGTTANFAAGGASGNRNGAAMLFQAPADAAKLAREALRRTDGARPDSILPDIGFTAGTEFRLAYAPALDVALDRRESAVVAWQVRESGERAPLGRLTLWPQRNSKPNRASDAPPLPGRETYILPISLSFPAFEIGGTKTIGAQLVHDAAALGRLGHETYPVSLRIVPAPSAVSLSTRLGGLRFSIPGPGLRSEESSTIPGETGDDYSVWRFDAGEPIASPTGESRHSLRLRFVASAIDPLAPDTDREDRSGRPKPLLVSIKSLPNAVKSETVPYVLDMRETIGARSDRLLTAGIIDVRDDGASAEADRYAMLSLEPFSISAFEALPLKQRGSVEKSVVASYSSDTRSWSFKKVSEHYHYSFPAQAIGESMDKPRRLEIHDPQDTVAADDFCPPYVPISGGEEVQFEKRHIVQYRLTPSAEIWVRPSDTEQGFFRPEWATHVMFRQAGALGIGAALEAFRAEFLHGMPTGVDLNLERGAAGGARIAEIEALTGRPLGAIASAAVDRDIAERWDRITTMIARRPERLEFWMRAPGDSRTFTPARFAEGVNFVLRKSAAHRSPLVSPLIDPNKSAGPRVRDFGLAGGASWPLESALFTQRLLEAPRSNGGSIERIALSPLGGDADQRAEFLAGQLAIISETRGGRVQRHRVEIIGRISVFWHRAKHVVIYERTTSPSQQFGPEGGMATRSRRPILRKVSEFIELIEPVRHYPDDPAADAMSAGFLKAVRFNSKVIAVDSAWSEDIPGAGWRIPLWNLYAARQRPSVYPRPDVVTITAAEGPEDQPVIAQEILDPDNLFFFADTVEGHSDTDRWVARAGIDYSKMPAPNHAQQQPDSAAKAGRTEGRLPAAPRIPRGHRRFTWQLGPAARKTQINAGRAEEPIYAALETLSFQRATQLRTDAGLKERKRIEDLMTRAGEFVSGEGLSREIEAFKTAAAGSDDVALVEQAQGLAKALEQALASRHDKLLGGFGDILSDAPGTCDKMVAQLTGGVERQKLLILDAVRSWQSDAGRHLASQDLSTREQVIANALDQLDKIVGPLLDGAADELGRIGGGAERARQAVQDAQADLVKLVADAQQRLVALKAGLDRSKPWSAARIAQIHDRLREIRDGLIGDIEVATSDIRSRLAAELDGLSRRLGVEVGLRVSELLTNAVELKSLAQRQGSAIEDWLATLHAPLMRLSAPAGPFATAREAIGKLPPEHDALKVKALQLLGEIEARANDAAAMLAVQLGHVQRALGEGIEATTRAADTAILKVRDEVATIQAEALGLLADLRRDIGALGEPELQVIRHEILLVGAEAERIALQFADMGAMVDALIDETASVASRFIAAIPDQAADIFKDIDSATANVPEQLKTIQRQVRPGGKHSVYDLFKRTVLRPALTESFAILDEVGVPQLEMLERALDNVGDAVEKRIETFAKDTQAQLDEVTTAVRDLCVDLRTGLNGAIADLKEWGEGLETQARQALGTIDGILTDAAALRNLAETINTEARAACDALQKSWVGASAYADSVFNAAGQIGKGDLAAVPGQILRLYAAAASAPDLPNLDFARARLGYYYDELNKVIDTTPAEAWFGRLGEELRAMGLALPFNRLGDRLLPSDLSNFDIGKVFRNFGGLDLSKLFKGVKLPGRAQDAIRLSHAFDKKQARAWVQIDIDVPLPGRRPLLGVGPFKLDFVDTRLFGVLRLEASKDSDTIEQTGRAQILTDIDAVVSGQSMVRLEKLVIHYQKSNGLKVDFDPRNIRINPSLRFIQESLGKLIPDTVGGLKIIKEHGIPVGVSHDFEMPPINLMALTSGVSNIAISNQFSLIAYPDFVIADRFCLSRPDLPFLFSIFIIGGTGYVMVDVNYRPFSNALMVTVEAAAGGSAALGFAAGPVSGSVFITLSVALSYRKLIGRPGGGLTIACVLLIAGNVDVAGLATVYIGLLLRMNYRENGQIDGVGTLKIKIRVSRFFKFTVRRDVTYKLRNGGGGGGAAAKRFASDAATPGEIAQRKANKILEARG